MNIETLARVAAKAFADESAGPTTERMLWETVVRVVLEAMREPTEEMLDAAVPVFKEVDAILGMHAARGYQGLTASPLPIAWQAMIDSILTS